MASENASSRSSPAAPFPRPPECRSPIEPLGKVAVDHQAEHERYHAVQERPAPMWEANDHAGRHSGTRQATMNIEARNRVSITADAAGTSSSRSRPPGTGFPPVVATAGRSILPAQNEVMMVARPASIRETPRTTTTAKEVTTVSAGTTGAAVPHTASRMPSKNNHHQCGRRCRNSWCNCRGAAGATDFSWGIECVHGVLLLPRSVSICASLYDRVRNRIQKRPIVERLVQVRCGARGQAFLARLWIVERGNDHDRQRSACASQLILHLQPVHAGHVQIEDQAIGPMVGQRIDELPARCERLHRQVRRRQQPPLALRTDASSSTTATRSDMLQSFDAVTAWLLDFGPTGALKSSLASACDIVYDITPVTGSDTRRRNHEVHDLHRHTSQQRQAGEQEGARSHSDEPPRQRFGGYTFSGPQTGAWSDDSGKTLCRTKPSPGDRLVTDPNSWTHWNGSRKSADWLGQKAIVL